ncbi:response regulator [Tunturiibacter gelidoferens]|uniref:DNA-binding NarL/FixJ family response regulator n=1 Tax=Tunturiibacter gelidiferens TaxID=3069689 RepID=A0ACC5P024_9BACT|nr:response regulator transcription factor [Edaphobacter lichenicola]MBB5339963.1 DNA-binding NarL/FixJ family response regulator [Edaphobacter lichenicola]
MEHRPNARLLIADDHKLLAEACKSILEPRYQIIGIFTDGRSLLQAAFTLKPDVVILDIAMPGLNGLDAGEQIKRKMPLVKLIFLTMTLTAEMAADAFRRGASGYVLKQSAAQELIVAVNKVIHGESYLSPLIERDTVSCLLSQGEPHRRKITGRQTEVLQLLAEGMSMKEVATILKIKPGTVAFQKYRMMETLGVKTNAELLKYAMQHQLSCA